LADTLEEVRKHVEELIRRLSEAELEPEPEPAPQSAPMDAAALGHLETDVNALGRKVDQAGNLLAQVTDLLESQAERLETLELQVGEAEPVRDSKPAPTDEPAAPVAGPAQGATANPADPSHVLAQAIAAVREDISALGAELRRGVHDLDARIHDFDARMLDLSARFEDMREIAWQQRGEIRTIEERVLTLAEPSHAVTSVRAAAPVPEPIRKVAIAANPSPATEPPYTAAGVVTMPSGVAADAGSSGRFGFVEADAQPIPVGAEPSVGSEGAAILPDPGLETMDARTVRRLEDLVEREVRLQQEFTPGAPQRTGRRTRPSVMVVDDLPDARKILSIYLSRTGYHVVTAASAEDCLAKLCHHDIDAVVLDASMPGGGGAQVCRSLREDDVYVAKRHIPIIIYTGYPDEHPPSVVNAWGATDYVVKGGDMLPLITALVRHTKELPEPPS
jgi:CheY-like chemotaxis protein